MKQRERWVFCGYCVCCVCETGFCRSKKKKKKKKQTLFSLQTADLWSTSSPADACRCGPQTADLLHLKKQTPPKCRPFINFFDYYFDLKVNRTVVDL
ncbi:hypothetical protein HanXRQr2_Chr01g0027861 [Helianthus annuus]|uniref:Uncharacterized protein n=1 Tax=Helianthus annuus TaxID=4232 RepID=A0A9K3P3F2_HELAN|nr:hypothetical protein HanXRQr2_Chr01g0027861 [Helianthus annuus]